MSIKDCSTGTLLWLASHLDALPSAAFLIRSLRNFRVEVELELIARRLPSIADESGGYVVAPVPGVH